MLLVLRNFLLLALFVMFTSACALQSAQRQLDKERYVESIGTLVEDLNKRQSFSSERHKQKVLLLVNQSLQGIEGLPQVTNYQRTQRNEQLLSANQLLSDGYFAKEFSVFLQRYPQTKLRENIAQGYYQQAVAIPEDSHYAYQQKSVLLARGAQYADSQRLLKLSREYAQKYAFAEADLAYQEGLKRQAVQDCKAAASQYLQAQNIYAEFGPFKDSQTRFKRVDEAWRKLEMQHLFNLGQTMLNNADGSKAQQREIAHHFANADRIYQNYGGNPQAKALAEVSWAKGVITIGYKIDHKVNAYNPELEKIIIDSLKTQFSHDFYLIRPNSRGDITFILEYGTGYKEETGRKQQQNKQYTNQEGTVFNYTEQSQTFTNNYEIRLEVSSVGEIRTQENIIENAGSTASTVKYSGQVPTGWSDKAQALKKESVLRDQAKENLTSKVNNYFSQMEYHASHL